MAKGRKSHYINKLTTKDHAMLKAFRCVGYMDEKQLKEKLEIADRRIQNFIRDGHIERVEVFDKAIKKITQVYRLSKRGEEFARQQLNLSSFYRSISPEHDLALAHRYLTSTQAQQQNWITEKEWRDKFFAEIDRLKTQEDYDKADELQKMWEEKRLSLPDGGYVEGGGYVMVEITTNNYGRSELAAKSDFAEVMHAQYQSYKI